MDNISFPTNPIARSGMLEMLRTGKMEKIENLQEQANDLAAIERTAKQFESLLVTRMVESMRKSIPDSNLTQDAASGQMQDMFWQFMGQEVGNQGGLGLWKQVMRQIQETQGMLDNGEAAPDAAKEVSP
ncbi:MAG: rod-binding protein [Phycisphaerae bacterium]